MILLGFAGIGFAGWRAQRKSITITAYPQTKGRPKPPSRSRRRSGSVLEGGVERLL
jgi:hypothetical protein